MSVISDFLTNGLGTIIKPITDVLQKKTERKIAKDAIQGQLAAAKQADETTVTVNDQHLETVLAGGMTGTWKDEYITLSLGTIINGLMVGGILSGFGYPKFLEGMITAVQALSTTLESGTQLAFLIQATVLSAIGLSIWRKI